MKKLFNLTLITTILCSQTGCVGSQGPKEAFPYATAEIKQKLAKRIQPDLKTVPEDFFETLNYNAPLELILQSAQTGESNPLSILGDTTEEQIFWYYVMRLRVLTPYLTFPRAIDDPGFVIEWLNELTVPIEKFTQENPDKMQAILKEVIRYEETYPFNPMPDETEIKPITKEELITRYGFSEEQAAQITDKDIEQHYQEQIEEARKFPREKFNQVRQRLLQGYRDAVEQLKSGKTPEEYAETKRAEAGVTEYSVQIQAPALYPAELAMAVFALSKEEEGPAYEFPKIFLQNTADPSHNVRIENEKPLPYNLTLAWYSITENKIYTLDTDLPRQTLLEKLMGDMDKPWDAILVTLAPYGQVTLYAYNQITGKKEQIARYQAKEDSFSLDDFRQMDTMYESAEAPAADWKEYQQQALANFPKAAENLKNNGLPEKDPSEITYWNENPPQQEPLPSKEEINKMDKDGFTPLVNAVRANRYTRVPRLIAAGADVNLPASSTGETPLGAAVSMGYLQMAKDLLSAGADVNFRNTKSSYTPLMEACLSGNEEAVKLLLQAGADVNARVIAMGQELNENALSLALNNNYPQIAELLRQAGAEELAAEEVSPASQAAAEAAYKAMGMTPLHVALTMGETAKIQELINQGADVNAAAPNMGTPLLYACTVGNVEAARALIAAKADVNIAGDTGYTPLLMACQTGNAELVKLLIAAGTDVNVKHVMNGQETGLTPLKIAQDYGFAEIAQLLTQAGAK